MKIQELKGKDIKKAYDGDILSEDFGYSCANFNVTDHFGRKSNQENDLRIYDLYIENPNNISCFVAYDDRNRILGRRMFFKGPSILNDEIYDVSVKRGEIVKYLYGYYGESDRNVYVEISKAVIAKYGKGIIHTDTIVLRDGSIDRDLLNFFAFQIDKAVFPIYPPTDHLYICPELKAFANFNPDGEVLKVIERDYNKKNLRFNQAYRYNPNRKNNIKHNFWLGNFEEEEEEEEE